MYTCTCNHANRGRVTLTAPIGNTSIDLPQNLLLIRASVGGRGRQYSETFHWSVNAADNKQRDKSMNSIKITIDA